MINRLRQRRDLLIGMSLLVLTAAIYSRTLGYGFTNFDDNDYVSQNPHVTGGLTAQSVNWAFTTGYESTWQPLVWVSYLVDVAMFGPGPRGFHFTNVLLHAVNALLLFVVLRRATRHVGRSGFVAALFAIHPLHVESVAWIAERKDVLSSLFWMLAMLAYVHYTEKRSLPRYGLVASALALGLMAKPMLVTLPFVFLLLDYWPLARYRAAGLSEQPETGWALVREKIPLFAIAAASGVITYIVQQRGGAVSSLALIPMGARIANAVVSYVRYLEKTFWPLNLSVIYPHPGSSLPTSLVFLCGLFLVSATVAISLQAKGKPHLPVGWLWFLGSLVPVIGLIPIGSHAMADRFTYLPLIGVFIIIAWGVPEPMPGKRFRWVIGVPAMAALLALTVRAYDQVEYWRDSFTLFEHALECTPRNSLAHNQLGAALHERGEVEAAIRHYRMATSISPDYVPPRNNLGVALLEVGQASEAIPLLEQVERSRPRDVQVRIHLATALQKVGRVNEAVLRYRDAAHLAPNDIAVHGALGNLLLSQGKTDEAIAEYLEMVRVAPRDPSPRQNLAVAFFAKGDYARAWQEVKLCEAYGGSPKLDFLDALSSRMTEPER
jgi:Flp pilus assembly protein TadD